jgi:hypothetical protein
MSPNKEKTFIDRLMPAPLGGGFKMEDYWVWCGSVIKGEDGKYHMFASRWPKKYPMFSGYILASEIVRAVSDKPEGPYRFVEKVLPSGDENAWDGRMVHNPSICRWEGEYLLYYIGSTYSGTMNVPADNNGSPQCDESYANIRIGLAAAPSVEGPWKTLDVPILEPRPEKWDSRIVTNPAPCLLPGGRVLLYYRSNTPQGLRIGLAVADSPKGPYRRLKDGPILEGMNVEDPFAWYNGTGFEMLAKDMSGDITGEIHAGAHLHSQDGVKWIADGKGYSRNVLWNDGRRVMQGCLERPQILFDSDAKPQFLFAAIADGPGGFRNASNTWTAAIPLSHP